MANAPHIAYRPDVDGLRAIAVLAVLLFHAFPTALPSGFIGVDIFFVISGYLISGIIFDGIDEGTFTFTDFYSRRIRRIFPALALVCGTCLVFGWLSMMPDEFHALGKHVVGGAVFISNIVLLRESGYFDVDANLKPLLHLWSLGIEEQYYLIWPVLLVLCRGRRARFIGALLCVGLGSFVINLYYTRANIAWAYYLPITRFFELMIGSGLAFANRRALLKPSNAEPPAPWANLKSLLAVAALVVCFIFIDERQPFPGWWALLVCGSAALLVHVGPNAWINRHILASRPMVAIGLISYPLYLWHWPIISFEHIIVRNPPADLRIAGLLAGVLLAWLTYKFVELPVRRNKGAPQLRRVTLTLATAMIAVAVVGGLARLQLLRPISAGDPRNLEIAEAREDQVNVVAQVIEGNVKRTTLFFGDSHMQQYWSRIEFLMEQSAPRKTVELRTLGGCGPFPLIERAEQPGCLQFVTDGFRRATDPDVDTIVIASSWKGFVERGDYFRPGFRQLAHLDVMAPQNQWIFDAFSDELLRLRQLGKRVVVLTSSPRGYPVDPGRLVDRTKIIPRYAPGPPVTLRELHDLLDPIDSKIRAAAQRAGVEVLDPDPWVCDSTLCPAVDDRGRPMYHDATHIRATTAQARAVGLDQFVFEARNASGPAAISGSR
jgi:peptidoglycan/LPS O-acetylase OafA/YrhL